MEALTSVDWKTLFTPSSSILEMVVRGTLTYWFCLVYLRIFRRGASQTGLTDLLLITLIADAAQNAMANDYKSVTEGFALVGTLVFWDFFLDFLGMHNLVIRRFNAPEPRILVRNGEVIKQNLRKEFLSEDELQGMLREQGVDGFANVRECYIESSGNLSVLKKGE